MKKYAIGFNTTINKESDDNVPMEVCKGVIEPKKSIVQVYFPSRDMSWAYYNDSFDLKIGDLVYVEGKLEGKIGRVVDVNYSFKIKISDYKKVVSVVDTTVNGDFFFVDSHLVTFDKNALPYKKALAWFKSPDNEDDFESSDDNSFFFSLDDLTEMNIRQDAADRGHQYYLQDKVIYLCIDGSRGKAIVEGSEIYEVEFDYSTDRTIKNIKCSCFCSGRCKHEFATMLQLRDILDIISEKYVDNFKDYFAAISKRSFISTVMCNKESGKISLEA